MKKCAYCGRESPDEARECRECGTSFVSEGEESTGPPPPLPNSAEAAAKKQMIHGALWCLGGLLVTGFTYFAASGGGTYYVAWGAILFGGLQFFRGFNARDTNSNHEDLGYEALARATKLESIGRMEEALVAYQKIVEQYPETEIGNDAKKSIEGLLARRG